MSKVFTIYIYAHNSVVLLLLLLKKQPPPSLYHKTLGVIMFGHIYSLSSFCPIESDTLYNVLN